MWDIDHRTIERIDHQIDRWSQLFFLFSLLKNPLNS